MKIPTHPAWTRRAAVTSCALLFLAQSALATWSVVAVDHRTGEVCVASATCLTAFNLKNRLPVIVVGKGAAAAQSAIDAGAINRMRIWNGIIAGAPPDGIIERLSTVDDQHESRQYGIVTLEDGPATFTGLGCADNKYGIAADYEDYSYSIQGNILTGVGVVYYAEQAFITTNGDLSQRVMAAMEAARSIGGDGRCSCSTNAPTSCGAPPPSFTFSAYTAFIVLARIGDQDGVCQDPQGCANGNYFLSLNVISSHSGPEPVLKLEQDYTAWRLALADRADQIKTKVTTSGYNLVADGQSSTHVDVQLENIEGVPLTNVPATLSIMHTYEGGPFANTGPITDHGSGHFSFDVTASTTPGQASWAITVVQPGAQVRLYPDLKVRVDPLAELHCGFDRISATSDFHVPLTLNLGGANAGSNYLVLASASGTNPGIAFQGVTLPLNRDLLFMASYTNPSSSSFENTSGMLDANGRAHANFVVSPALLGNFVGRHVDWAGLVFGAPNHVTNNAGFDVVP